MNTGCPYTKTLLSAVPERPRKGFWNAAGRLCGPFLMPTPNFFGDRPPRSRKITNLATSSSPLLRGRFDPDNLYHRYFQPVLTKAGLRKIRLHDLRHTFGSLLIQSGASLGYVKEQMGHRSIQVTVDTCGQLIPGADVSFVDRVDRVAEPKAETSWQQSEPPRN